MALKKNFNHTSLIEMQRASVFQLFALATTCAQLVNNSQPVAKTRFRLTPVYHISAPYGYMHGPSSFVRYKGIYHIFYEISYPQHSSGRHWGHAISSNLIDWTHVTVALLPREFYETKSCLSGSAFPYENKLNLFYTGQVNTNNETYETQNLAYSRDGFYFKKFTYNPIVSIFPKGIGNFRHPKVWRKNNKWYMLIGSSTKRRKGCLYMCSSSNIHEWREVKMIASSADMGSAWENPDLFQINGRDVLILTAKAHRDLIGDSIPTRTICIIPGYEWWNYLDVTKSFYETLDYGHDFNIAKTARAPDGRRLLIGWMGTLDTDSAEKISSGMLTTVREITLGSNNELLMLPVREIMDLREELMFLSIMKPGEMFFASTKSFELVVNTSNSNNTVVLDLIWSNTTQYTISYTDASEVMSVERPGPNGFRTVHWKPQEIKWRIFVDYCSIEVFCGEGEIVFSSLIYPQGFIQVQIGGKMEVQVAQYRLRPSIKFSKSFYN